MSRKRKQSRTPVGELLYRLILFIRRLIDAFRHVKTGGKSTERRARARAAAPPQRCPECGQEVLHSPDWRDHLEKTHEPGCSEYTRGAEGANPNQAPDQ